MEYYSAVEKEKTTDTLNSVHESQNHHAKWNKPGAKECVLYDSMSIKF